MHYLMETENGTTQCSETVKILQRSMLKRNQYTQVSNKDYTKKLRDDDICSEVGCILYRMKT